MLAPGDVVRFRVSDTGKLRLGQLPEVHGRRSGIETETTNVLDGMTDTRPLNDPDRDEIEGLNQCFP